jgi:capsid protein
MIMEATNMGYFNATNTDIASQAKALARQATAQANTDPDTGESLTMREVGGAHASKVGGWYVLENEEAMTFNDMKAPGNNFGIANEWAVNMFGMATAIPPEVIMGKYSTSYTAHRGAFNDFWQIVMNDRNDYTDGVENPVNLEYLKHFVVTGQIEVIPEFWTDYKVQMAYLEGTFLGPVPGHINPLQEVKANAESVKQGFTLRSNIAAQQGNDFWNQIDLWEKEQTRWMEASPDYKEKVLLADIAAKQTSGAFDESDESETMENENLKPKARAVKKDKRDE